MGPKKGRDNGPVLITEIVLAVFDSCIIWFISFLYVPAALMPAVLPPFLITEPLWLWMSFRWFLLSGVGSVFCWLILSPAVSPHTFPTLPGFLRSCFLLYCRLKTLTWPCWPAFLWLCLTLLYAGGYPLVHRWPFPCVVPLCPSPPSHEPT